MGGDGLTVWSARRACCRMAGGHLLAAARAALSGLTSFATVLFVTFALAGTAAIAEDNLLAISPTSAAQSDQSKPMLLQADELVYDNEGNRVTAVGNVEIYYNNYTLLADRVVYDQGANTLTAEGNVRIKEPDGAIISADHITLTDDFRDGFISSLKVVTAGDARIAAGQATRQDAETTIFDKAVFTPCKPCAEDPEAAPVWRIRADRIIHKRSEANLYFENAYLDILGTPVLYVPYFYSPDPSVKRRSGFLAPIFGHSNDLGYSTEIPYFWAIAPNMDVTFNPKIMSKEGVLVQGTFRHRIENGTYSIEFAGIHQNDTDEAFLGSSGASLAGVATGPLEHDFRGSIVTKGNFELGSWWRAGWDATIESDDTFRRFYKLDSRVSTDRVSEAHLVGMSERNYFGTYLYHFGGLLTDDTSNAESRAHPSLDYSYIFDTPVLGGELSIDVNALSLSRDEGADSSRVIGEVSWRRQLTDWIGQVYTPFLQARGDAYKVSNVVDPLTGIASTEDVVTRGTATAGLQYQYPFVAHTEDAAHVIEPVVQVLARPDSVDQIEVPNEDAQSLVFDDTLLFDIDKFSGYDRIETGVRLNYGLQYTMQRYDGGSFSAVIGRSEHLSGENPFAPGTGLETDSSDYVAGLYYSPNSNSRFVAQSRFDSETFDLVRQDLSASASYGPFAGTLIYAFDRSTDQVGDVRQDQEIQAGLSLRLAENWTAFGTTRYDIDGSQFISDSLGLKYADECYALSVTYAESYIRDRDVDPDQSVMVRFELKTLGGTSFKTDNLGSSSAEEDKSALGEEK